MRTASHLVVPLELVVALAVTLTPGLSRAQQADPTDECPTPSPRFRVGHTIEYLNVTGTLGENRPIQVHVWYPAREQDDCDEAADIEPGPGGCHAPPALYTSRLYGLALPSPWSPLSWIEPTSGAFEDARLAGGHERFPAIVFSHGNDNNAVDHAYLLETLASYGYVVAAPDHINNTQDDIRIDFLNKTAKRTVVPCFDGTASPCSTPDVARTMVDRVRDIGAVYDALPTWFGHRVDTTRVGVMGHSRGSVTALTIGGGSSAWGISPDARFKAILGLSIGAVNVASNVDFQEISVPTLLMSGTLEPTGLQQESAAAFALIGSADKQRIVIPNATHRHFDSALCAQVQSSASIAQGDPNAILDLHTLKQDTVVNVGNGVAMDFCGFETFTSPADIRKLVQSLTTTTFPPSGFVVTGTDVPTHGLTSDTVESQVLGQAVSFFGRVLDCADHRDDTARHGADPD